MDRRTRFIEHAGRAILLMDFSHLWRVDEIATAIEEARRFVGGQPKAQTCSCSSTSPTPRSTTAS